MSDTEIIDWLEKHYTDYLLVPPSYPKGEWGLYKFGHVFVSQGTTMRQCLCIGITEIGREETK